MNNRIGRPKHKPSRRDIPDAKLPDSIAVQLSSMQVEVLTRVMNDNANHRLNDLVESHGEIGDAVIAGMMGSGIGEKFNQEQRTTLFGLMKLCFLWGVRAQQEGWTARYQPDGK